MAQSPSQVEGRAFDVGWRIVKRRLATYPTCADVNCMAQVENHGDYCIRHKPMDNPLMKGKFQGYSKNNISGRAERQSKRRAWGQSRKNKSKNLATWYMRSTRKCRMPAYTKSRSVRSCRTVLVRTGPTGTCHVNICCQSF